MIVRTPFGEGVLLAPASLPTGSIERARALGSLARAIGIASPSSDVVIGGQSVLVLGPVPDLADLPSPDATHVSTTHTIEVVYDGADLDAVASARGLRPDEVVARHTSRAYTALLTGFMPGFAYLGDVDPRIARPRLAQPRTRVPPGSVAIAGSLTGIYPFESPGGWNLLGRAIDPALFDPKRVPARRIAPMDEVLFVARSAADVAPEPEASREPLVVTAAALRVESTAGVTTIQDAGRLGLRGSGIPWSGPMDAEAFAAANAAVGNAADAAAIEVLMGALTVVAERDTWVSVDGAAPILLRAGDRLRADPAPKLSCYLAVRGGVDVPVVLGSRATLRVARLGGLSGRPLRRGDGIPVGRFASDRSPDAPVREHPGADATEPEIHLRARRAPSDERLAPDAFDRLLEVRFTVSPRLDRVGTRLDGPTLPRPADDRSLPDPVLPGAVQVTTDGTPVVLGPDCAVTGGYPVVALLDPPSRSRLGRLRPGSEVLFREVGGP